MRNVKVVILVAGIIMCLSVLSSVVLGDVTVTTYIGNGNKTKQTIKSNTKADIRIDCRNPVKIGCDLCGACHMADKQSFIDKLDQKSWAKHTDVYFPKQTLSLSEGQKINWEGDEGYYIKQRNRLVRYDKSNKKIWTAPPGSRILKNEAGEPIFVWLTGAPIKGS